MLFGKRNDLKSVEISLGSTKFDTASGYLFDTNGQELGLRHQSREVLKILAQRPKQIVSRDRLVNIAWSGRRVSPDSVAQCIAEIRRVLGDSDKRLIETIPSKGYRLVPPIAMHSAGGWGSLVAAGMVVFACLALVWGVRTAPAPQGPPVIVVLPFSDFSATPHHDYLSDAISESVITVLARYPQMTVISRNSSFRFHVPNLGIAEIADRVGADFVLEKSQFYDGSHLRITAQLTDGGSEAHLWTDEVDVAHEALLQTNSQISVGIANAVGFSVVDNAEAQMTAGDVSALMIANAAQGRIMRSFTRANLLTNIAEQEQSIRYYPDFAWGYLGQALSLRVGLRYGWIEGDEATAHDRMYSLARTDVELDPNNFMAYHALGRILLHDRDVTAAIRAFRRGVELNHSSSLVTMGLADALVYVGKANETLVVIAQLERIDPLYGFGLTWAKSSALWQAGDCEQALDAFQAARSMPVAAYKELAAIHHCLGNQVASADAIQDYLAEKPTRTVSRERATNTGVWTAPRVLKRWLLAL